MTAEFIWAIICAVLAIVCLIISIMSFNEKGFVFNNAYIWANKREREQMDKKPYYRQSEIAFALCTAIFFFMALECVLFTGWLWLVVGLTVTALLIYSIASSANKQKK